MVKDKASYENVPEMAKDYGEPCSNCKLFDGCCDAGHRTKRVIISTGHLPEVWVRRIGGCQDHQINAGLWYSEDRPRPFSQGYGGSSTNILC